MVIVAVIVVNDIFISVEQKKNKHICRGSGQSMGKGVGWGKDK